MKKNIKTHEADIKLTQKFLDYANCADASYARLEYIHKNIGNDKKADDLTFGNKLNKDIEIKDDEGNLLYTKPKDTNTAYACAIEARFEQDTIGKKYNNNIIQVKLDSKLSKRTINFVNRFQLLFHQPNTESGFSATLFRDTQADSKDSEYILAFRGTEDSKDIFEADVSLIGGAIPKKQYLDMLDFYGECIEKEYITESTPLIITGHSLWGCLAQSFCLCNKKDSKTKRITL
ncbi:hypothetical protein [Helicobacter trogontum]|uniref:hypothetical protein n=1 Tax=Helicobacter trogontum TaxID=50960 RepID=UPI001F3B4667|nr:hypothetical protein [Helicobacter trogontum]